VAVTIHDVARAAGVSAGTVSNVVNDKPHVTSGTSEKVLSAMKELGYIPKSAAWHARRPRQPVIALLSPDIANPFSTEVTAGLLDAAFKAGHALQICDTNFSEKREDEHLRTLAAQGVGGIVIASNRESTAHLEFLQKQGVAVVLVGREAGARHLCSVSVDDALGGTMVAEHLIGLGHRRILWISGADSVPRLSARQRAVARVVDQSSIANRGIRLDTAEITNATAAYADAFISRALLDSFEYTAIACINDLVALGVVRALTRVGIRVPEDVSVIGYDDINYAADATVPLTTVRQPMREIGRAAARLLLFEQAEGAAHAHQHARLVPKLIQRASTRPAAR